MIHEKILKELGSDKNNLPVECFINKEDLKNLCVDLDLVVTSLRSIKGLRYEDHFNGIALAKAQKEIASGTLVQINMR